MYARISMSELNEPEDRSMIVHACDKCARCVLFFSDIIYYRTYVGVCVTPFFFFFGVRCAQYKVHAQCSFAALAPHMPCMLLVRIISTVSMASAVRNCRCPWKLESYVSCAFLDR